MPIARFLFVCLMAFLPALAAAGEARSWKITAAYDYYFPTNSGEGLRSQLQAQSDDLIAGGYDSTSFGVHATGGSGARVGALFPWDRRTMLGASFGYVLGPTLNSDFTAASATLGNGGTTINLAVGYFRLLGNSRILLFEKGRGGISLDSGFGLGVGTATQSCTSSGSLSCAAGATSRTWEGFTWEFSPVFSYRLRDADINFGPRYVGFPRFNGNDQIAPILWQALGFFFGATF